MTNLISLLSPIAGLVADDTTTTTGPGSAVIIGVLIIVVIFGLVIFAILAQFFGLYVQAYTSGAKVTIFDLLGMRLRKVNAAVIVRARIQAFRAGLHVTQGEMESHLLAGGDVQRV